MPHAREGRPCLRQGSGRQARTMKIPLNPPFSKGEVFLLPFVKGGGDGFKRAIFYIIVITKVLFGILAERVGFEPTSPFGRTAFRERRLKPTRQPLQDIFRNFIVVSHPIRLARSILVRARGWDVLASFRLPRLRRGRRTHVSFWENPVLTGRLKPTRQPLLS